MKVIYTYIFNEWDWLKPPVKVTPGWKYVCFTDEDNPWLPGSSLKAWEIVRVKDELTPKRRAGYYLTHGLELFGDSEIIISVTGQCHVIGDLDVFVEKFLKRDYCLMHHPSRNCTYKEAAACMRSNRDDPEVIARHMEKYRAEGLPANAGMVQTGIIGRRNTVGVKEFERLWWEEIQNGSQRDQLSWNYVLWEHPGLIDVDYWKFDECHWNHIAVTPHYRKNQKNK
jgi:hypothetical protein